MKISVAIPIYNEETAVLELLTRTGAVLDHISGGPHEIVVVDDGSTDCTHELLEKALSKDPRIQAVYLSRNFGHQAAITAAMDHASGEAVVIMDGDLQDTPETIPLFVEKYREGYDVVYAQRVNRKEVWWLRACFYFFYRLIASLSDTHLPLDSGDFGLMSRRVVDLVRHMPEHHRYLRGLRGWVGFKQIGVLVEREVRHSGESKYSAARRLKFASDAIFAFSIVPIRAATFLGLFGILFSVAFTLYSIYAKYFLNTSIRGFTALTTLMTLLASFILLFLGVIGEYVGRIYEEVKARPHYIVGQTHGSRFESKDT